ncbi:activator of Hsp90 ATPase-like protein [Actinoplanes italicus]|uniref:Activator of Hsp90 ATPase-like protein n=2 Tax=Actinoplanes italicus TaxID=113567 RepID=A0A2T0K8C8_9ACTN|nr:activator of Hsp90 ATPase-like protein [Actinoplanes italicus]
MRGVSDNVHPMKRPPIRQSTLVRSDREHTFEVFVRDIGAWWPTRSHSLGLEKVTTVTIERELGGRIYETWTDGRQVDWGEVILWQPTERFAMTWTSLPEVTEVELTFTALSPALTRVALEHRGWERLTAEQVAAATSLSGGYEAGWKRILDIFTRQVEAGTVEGS